MAKSWPFHGWFSFRNVTGNSFCFLDFYGELFLVTNFYFGGMNLRATFAKAVLIDFRQTGKYDSLISLLIQRMS